MVYRSSDIHPRIKTTSNDGIEYLDTFWEDLRVSINSLDRSGAGSPPNKVTIVGNIWGYEFNNNDEVGFNVQLPHTYKQGTDLKVHAHWTPRLRGNEENGNTVAWKVELIVSNIGSAFPGSSTVYDLTDTCSGTDLLHELTPTVTITGSSLTISSMIIGRIYRDAGDTWSLNTATNRPVLLELDFHYEIDSPGSKSELTK